MRIGTRITFVVAVASLAAAAPDVLSTPAAPPAIAPAAEVAPPEPDAPLFAPGDAAAGAQSVNTSGEYGTCYLSCDMQLYPISFLTVEECCDQLHLCPDSSEPISKHWEPFSGWPFFCGPS